MRTTLAVVLSALFFGAIGYAADPGAGSRRCCSPDVATGTSDNYTTGNFGFVDAGTVKVNGLTTFASLTNSASTTVNCSIDNNFCYFQGASLRSTPDLLTDGKFRSLAAGGADGLSFDSEAEIQWPDTKIAEVGTALNLTAGSNVLVVNGTQVLARNAGLTQFSIGTAGNAWLDVQAGSVTAATGTGLAQGAVGGTLSIISTAVGNFGASAPDDLQSYTLPANTLTTTNRGIRITARGTCTNNANAKTFTVNFGSQVVLTHACTVSVAGESWKIETTIVRTGSSTQDWESTYYGSTGAAGAFEFDPENGTATQTESGSIVIKMQSTASTTDNDIVQELMIVEAI